MVIIDGMPASKPQIATHPRKGTVTFNLLDFGGNVGITTYPRKGTVTFLKILIIKPLSITTYPRKGTETSSSTMCTSR